MKTNNENQIPRTITNKFNDYYEIGSRRSKINREKNKLWK